MEDRMLMSRRGTVSVGRSSIRRDEDDFMIMTNKCLTVLTLELLTQA